MKDIYSKEKVEKLAEEVISSVRDKVKDQIADAVYGSLSGYLYEHYTNNKEKIEGELINSIVDEYKKSPKEYKFAKLREKMFIENKEGLTKVLTDEAIYKSVEDVIEQYTHRNYHFEWRWKDGIARFILENLEKFKDDKRINDWFSRELQRKDNTIRNLEEQLAEIKDLVD